MGLMQKKRVTKTGVDGAGATPEVEGCELGEVPAAQRHARQLVVGGPACSNAPKVCGLYHPISSFSRLPSPPRLPPEPEPQQLLTQLYSRGLVYYDVLVGPHDHIAIPPLEVRRAVGQLCCIAMSACTSVPILYYSE